MNSKVIGVLDVIVINYCYHGTSQLYHGLLWEKFFGANFMFLQQLVHKLLPM